MNTHPTDEQLSAFNDACLDGDTLRRVARHVEGCAVCQQSARALQSVRQRLHSLPAPPVPAADFWADTYRRMRVDERERRAARSAPALARWAAGGALTAVLGAFLAAPFMTQTVRPVPPAPVVSADFMSADFVDVGALVEAHAHSAARQPLADADRQTLLAAEGDPLLAPDASDADAPR